MCYFKVVPAKKAVKKQSKTAVQTTIIQDETVTPTEKPTKKTYQINNLDEIQYMQPGEMIALSRTGPRSQDLPGYLEDMPIPDHGVDGLHTAIKERHGGGTFRVQAKNATNGWGKGTALLEIAGRPISVCGQREWDGARWINRITGTAQSVTMGAPAQSMANPAAFAQFAQQAQASSNQNNDLTIHTLRLLGDLLKNQAGGGDNGLSGDNLVGLVGALQQQIQPQKSDPFDQVERVLKLGQMMSGNMPAVQAQESEGEDSLLGGLLGGGGGGGLSKILEFALVKKLLGDDAGGLLGGMIGGAPAPQAPQQQGPGPAPSPHHLWHPQHGWVVPAPQNVQNTPPPPKEPPKEASAPQPQEPPPPVEPVVTEIENESSPVDEQEREGEDDAPLNTDEIAGEFNYALSKLSGDDEKAKFILDMMEKTGMKDVLPAMQQIQQQAHTEMKNKTEKPNNFSLVSPGGMIG